MDTDDLSLEAYSIIVEAGRACDLLCPQLAILAGRCKSEDEWLQIVQKTLHGLCRKPEDYLIEWGYDDSEIDLPNFSNSLKNMIAAIDNISKIPINERSFDENLS